MMVDPVNAASVIEKATHYGWEAGLIALIVVSLGGLFIWLMRQQISEANKREERMAARIDKLEDFQRAELKDLADQCRKSLDANSAVVDKLLTSLNARPCLWQLEHQAWVKKQLDEENK